MNRVRFGLTVIILAMVTGSLRAQAKPDDCPMKFSVGITDALSNADSLTENDQKWLEKFLQRYQGMCYIHPSADVKILLSITITAQTEQVVPRVANVPVYTLRILDARGGTPKVVRTFQRSKAGSTTGSVTGLVARISNPERQVIEDAVDWIAHANIDLGTEPEAAPKKAAEPKS